MDVQVFLTLIFVVFLAVNNTVDPSQTPQRRAFKDSPDRKALLSAASAAADAYLKALKAQEIPEAKRALKELQWDRGLNFYNRPRFSDASLVFHSLFDTDVPGVYGYKRLSLMKAADETGKQIDLRSLIIAYQDRKTKRWKIFLENSTVEGIDVENEIRYSKSRLTDTQHASPKENFATYALWLIYGGKLTEAQAALHQAQAARAVGDGTAGSFTIPPHAHPILPLQIGVTLKAVAQITGQEK